MMLRGTHGWSGTVGGRAFQRADDLLECLFGHRQQGPHPRRLLHPAPGHVIPANLDLVGKSSASTLWTPGQYW